VRRRRREQVAPDASLRAARCAAGARRTVRVSPPCHDLRSLMRDSAAAICGGDTVRGAPGGGRYGSGKEASRIIQWRAFCRYDTHLPMICSPHL